MAEGIVSKTIAELVVCSGREEEEIRIVKRAIERMRK
jgi:hypothetical protein